MDYLEEAKEVEAVESAKNYKSLWFIFFGFVSFVIILVLLLVFVGGNRNISDNRLMEGVALEVGESDAVNFDFDEEKHGMVISFVGDDSVELTISSDPINLTLKINEVKEVDLNNDRINDIRIKLISIVEGKATIALQKIVKDACQEDWDCSEWSACSRGIQKRECSDFNSCGSIFNKPLERKDCLEMEFIEDNSAFQNESNKSVNNSLNNTIHQNVTNITINNNTSNKTTLNNYTNKTDIIVNVTNHSIEQIKIIYCENSSSYYCFINASKTCYPAVWNFTSHATLFGVASYSTVHYEIKGNSSDGRCIYYEKRLAGSLVYTDALVNDLLQQGYTTANISKMQHDAQSDMNSLIGTEKICKMNKEMLTSIFSRWSEGEFSTEDFANAECYPHGNFDCKLDFNGIQVTGMTLNPVNTGSDSGTGTISVRGYSNSSKITWRVENSSVIGISPGVGNYSRIYPLKIGKTTIIITDGSLSSCQLKTSFQVYAPENGGNQSESNLPAP
jgi:hypothetical protein